MKTIQFNAQANTGMSINTVGTKLSGIISIPDVSPPVGGYPVLVSYHGAGEASKERDLNKLYNNGIPKLIKAGTWNYPFVVLAIQDMWSTPQPATVAYVLEEYVLSKYPTNRTKIFHTGYSYGGGGSLAMAIHFPQYTTAVVSASPSSLSTDSNNREIPRLPEVAKSGIPVVFWAGSNEAMYLEHATAYAKYINDAGGKASLFIKQGVAHGPWDSLYKGQDLISGGLNMYDWLSKLTAEEQPEPEPEEPGQTPKLIATIKVYSDGNTETIKNI